MSGLLGPGSASHEHARGPFQAAAQRSAAGRAGWPSLRRRRGLEGRLKQGISARCRSHACSCFSSCCPCCALLCCADCDAIFDPGRWPGEKVALPSPITPRQLAAYGSFASGSMGPKVEAACRFVQATGGRAGVGRLADAVEIMRGRKGTIIAADA